MICDSRGTPVAPSDIGAPPNELDDPDELPAAPEDFSEIEEALAELFEASAMLASRGDPTLATLQSKIDHACALLDRPWP